MFHQDLLARKWQQYSFFMQMANVGAEIGRAMNWRAKNAASSQAAFDRGLELLDLTIADPKNTHTLKELCRLREALADYFYFSNEYGSTDKSWHSYFYPFNYAASLELAL